MNKEKYFGKINKEDLLFLVFFAAALIFSFWKCKYGFGERDEAFYLLLPHRLHQGDSMFFDERHICLLFSFLTYPLLEAYLKLFKDMEGAILHFRYLYLFFQALCSLVIYMRLKKISPYGAILSSIIFLLYSPFNIMTFSYNTICIMCLSVSLVLLLTNRSRMDLFVSGLLYAGAVLCNPYLSITYFVYSFLIVGYWLFDRKKGNDHLLKWLHYTFGIVVLFVLFVVFVFSRISFNQFIDSLGFVLMNDGYYSRTIFDILIDYFRWTVLFTDYSTYLIGLLLLVQLIYIFDRKKKERRVLYFSVSAFVDLLYLAHIINVDGYINYVMFPVNLLGILTFVYFWDESSRKELILYFVPAFLYTVYVSMASNTTTYGIMSASSVMLIMSVVKIIKMTARLDWKSAYNKVAKIIVILLMCLQLGGLSYAKYKDVFSRRSISKQTYKIEHGPYKGTVVGKSNFDAYEEVCAEVDSIRANFDGDSIVLFTPNVWMYLIMNDYKIASPSSWYTLNPERWHLVDNMNRYYEENPNKIPDLIYVEDGFEDVVKQLDIIGEYSRTVSDQDKVIYVRK